MKYIYMLNDKPLSEATHDEIRRLEEKVKKAGEKHFGIRYPDNVLDDIQTLRHKGENHND